MRKTILFVILLSFTISNAQKNKKIKGNEKIVTVTRTTNEYERIIVAGSFDIKLAYGKEGNISIKGDENLLEFIKIEVNEGTLSVFFDKRKSIQFNYNSVIEITIPFEKINNLSFTGSGNLTNFDSINSENLDFTMTGSGNVQFETETTNLKITKSGSGNLNIKGKTSNLEVLSTGSGNTNLSDLNSEKASATMSGSGSIEIYCTKKLIAKTAGSGNIQYKGNPEKVDKSSVGSGSISGK